MSKIVKVQNGNLKFLVTNDATPASATITLDTGARTGTTVITGDLVVQGTTTTVESNNTTITDNILVLNQGETHNYVTLQYSGIQISRGYNNTYGDAQIVYNEKTSINSDGTVVLRYTIGGTYIPLETNKIDSGGQDLTLYSGASGVVGVFGTTDYKARVVDDNALTNKGYVDYAIDLYFNTHFPGQIQATNTRVTVTETPAPEIGFVLANSLKATINSSGFTIDSNINLSYNSITNLSGASNLRLAATNGNIELAGYVVLVNQTSQPSPAASAGTIYAKSTEGPGRSGIYFVNNTPNADELVSKNRALLWSMLF
jgi:hypothetical protein